MYTCKICTTTLQILKAVQEKIVTLSICTHKHVFQGEKDLIILSSQRDS